MPTPIPDSPADLSLDALIAKAWNTAYAGERPEAALMMVRQKVRDLALTLPHGDAGPLDRAFKALAQAWTDFPADLREKYLAVLFTPSVAAALPDGTLHAWLKLPLPTYPGLQASIEQVLRRELEVRAPLSLEQAVAERFFAPGDEALSACREADALHAQAVRRWRAGHHLASVREAFEEMGRTVGNLIHADDQATLRAITGKPLRPFSFAWRDILRLLAGEKDPPPTTREVLDAFDQWIELQADFGMDADSLRENLNQKQAARQPLSPAEKGATKFLLVRFALAEIDRRWWNVMQAWGETRRIHDPAHDGIVLRDKEGRPIEVIDVIGLRPDQREWISDVCQAHPFLGEISDMEKRIVEAARPFLLGTAPPAQRARLYDRVSCQPFTAAHIKQAPEEALLGQNTVVAAADIAPWQCIGAYGGTLLHGADAQGLVRSYYYSASPTDAPPQRRFHIDGVNLMCRINTICAYDEEGQPMRQADDGYNVEAVLLEVRLADNLYGVDVISMPVFFNTHPSATIRAGEELRLDYQYTPEMMAEL